MSKSLLRSLGTGHSELDPLNQNALTANFEFELEYITMTSRVDELA